MSYFIEQLCAKILELLPKTRVHKGACVTPILVQIMPENRKLYAVIKKDENDPEAQYETVYGWAITQDDEGIRYVEPLILDQFHLKRAGENNNFHEVILEKDLPKDAKFVY